MNKNTAHLLLGALNILTASSPLLAKTNLTNPQANNQISEFLNVVSLKSIESAWLKVPTACKARGFNASPVSLESVAVSPAADQIYSSYEA